MARSRRQARSESYNDNPRTREDSSNDSSDEYSKDNNSLRNLIIHYADTRIFLKYYLDRRINKNLPTIIRGLDPDNNIIYIAYRISRTINPDRL
ncbi:hypothetical protein N7539_003137 [Penicillium diatomitis]|uniref:Uncharacterized protein n=1 Tax=Penicillium diatomitis TaxID=2819901 RepID=A0A9W9XG01_9EURO|nr:uncharacterized protein N7539_003137 [Penicillium diatomitis]KAJ5491570.1 hypothetical protein N7539_003137 [Penicillium diatomitis]